MVTNNSWNSQNPAQVAMGGTGASSLTNHGVLVGSGTSAISALSVGATGTVLQGSTGANPTFTATPTVTSISFGGSALSTFTDWTSWTPTLDGSVSGTTTYSTQLGSYCRIGNVVIAMFNVTITGMTGTVNLQVGGFPFNFNNTASLPAIGSCRVGTFAFPASTTSVALQASVGNNFAVIICSGTGVGAQVMQASNVAGSVIGTITYRV